MAHPSTSEDLARDPAQTPIAPRVVIIRAALGFAASLLLLLAGYAAVNVPVAWFPEARIVQFPATDLNVTRGTASRTSRELLITATDENNTAVISLTASIRASDYAAIGWIAANVPDDADARLLWRSDYSPQKLNYRTIRVVSGRLQPTVVANDPGWIGHITGLALIIRAPLTQPIQIAGLEAKPMGAFEILRDRLGEWSALEGWTGTSINTVTGGADVQGLPLPLLIAAAIALGAGLVIAWGAATHRGATPLPLLIAVLFIFGYAILDARWAANLSRQVAITQEQYGWKSWRDKHLAAPDGPLFAFIEKVRTYIPDDASRVFVASDANFFRGRAAYHLYPHNVYTDTFRNMLPAPSLFRPGDWIVVYQRHGVQYDAGTRQLRWDGQAPITADVKLVDAGAALFQVR